MNLYKSLKRFAVLLALVVGIVFSFVVEDMTGWGPDWEWVPTKDPVGEGYWNDPEGGRWRPHPDPDGEHGGDHWDHSKPGRKRKKYRDKIGLDGEKLRKRITIGAGIAAGALIIGDIILGGPSGEGIAPALIIIGL